MREHTKAAAAIRVSAPAVNVAESDPRSTRITAPQRRAADAGPRNRFSIGTRSTSRRHRFGRRSRRRLGFDLHRAGELDRSQRKHTPVDCSFDAFQLNRAFHWHIPRASHSDDSLLRVAYERQFEIVGEALSFEL